MRTASIVAVIVMLLASSFVRPVNELINRIRQAGQGYEDIQIDTSSRDEIGELSRSFKEMVESVRDQTRLVQQINLENEKLLSSVLPERIANRLKSGERKIADQIEEVSVLFASLRGLNDLYQRLSAEELMTLLNEVISQFDDSTERFGMEKIKTFGEIYVAACGLGTPHLDHSRRAADFSRAMQRIVKNINTEHRIDLGLAVGIDAGPVISGIVGRERFIYDIFGNTVLRADHARNQCAAGEILVTSVVHDRIKDLFDFSPVTSDETDAQLWALNHEKPGGN